MDPRASLAPPAPRDWWWIFDPRLSLRAFGALILGGGTLVLVLVITGIATIMFRRSLEAQLGATYETLAAQVADKIDRTIYERYRTLQLAANLAPLRSEETTPADRRRLLEAIQETSSDFAWIGQLDARGRAIATTHAQSEGTDFSQRSWFVLGRERPFAGELHDPPGATARDDADTTARVFDLVVPFSDQHGRFAGVIAAQVRWNWTQDIPASVVSENARRELVGVTVYNSNKEVLLDSGASGWTQPPEPPAAAEGRRQRGAVLETTAQGSQYVAGYARHRGFREYRGLGWLSVVRQPAARALAPIHELKFSILRWGGFLVICTATAGWYLGSRHARRLRSIGTAASRIREGDVLTVLPRPAGESEVAHMCRELGDLVEDLREKNAPAKPEVAKR